MLTEQVCQFSSQWYLSVWMGREIEFFSDGNLQSLTSESSLGQFDLQMSGLFGGIASCSCNQISEAKTAENTDAVVPDKSKL